MVPDANTSTAKTVAQNRLRYFGAIICRYLLTCKHENIKWGLASHTTRAGKLDEPVKRGNGGPTVVTMQGQSKQKRKRSPSKMKKNDHCRTMMTQVLENMRYLIVDMNTII